MSFMKVTQAGDRAFSLLAALCSAGEATDFRPAGTQILSLFCMINHVGTNKNHAEMQFAAMTGIHRSFNIHSWPGTKSLWHEESCT